MLWLLHHCCVFGNSGFLAVLYTGSWHHSGELNCPSFSCEHTESLFVFSKQMDSRGSGEQTFVIDCLSPKYIQCAEITHIEMYTVWQPMLMSEHIWINMSVEHNNSDWLGLVLQYTSACLLFVCISCTVKATLYCGYVSGYIFSCFFMRWWGNLSGGNWRYRALKASRCELGIYPAIRLLSATFPFKLQLV